MATDEMGINERYQYLRRMQPRYQEANREQAHPFTYPVATPG